MSATLSPTSRPPFLFPTATNADATVAVTPEELRGSRFAFLAICAYLVSLMYLVPILPIGPSWAVFPNIPDMLMPLIFVTSILYKGKPSVAHISTFKMYVGYAGFYLLNYLILTIWADWLNLRGIEGPNALVYGINGMYRLTQAGLLFWAIMRIPMTPQRFRTIERILIVALLVSTVLMALTSTGIVTTTQLSPQIPADRDISGPWVTLYREFDVTRSGLGTINYNHGVVSSHIIVLTGLLLTVSRGRHAVFDFVLAMVAVFATFVSGSRTGFLAMVLLTMILSLKFMGQKPLYVILIGVVILLGLFFGLTDERLEDTFAQAIQRQTEIIGQGSNARGNLSGRTDIWALHLSILNENLAHWMIGSGLGTAKDAGHYGHNLYLTITFEQGLLGLSIFAFFMYRLLRQLWKADIYLRSMFWTTMVLLFTALTLDVFYTVPQRSQWLLFYFTAVSITLHLPRVNQIAAQEEAQSGNKLEQVNRA